MKLLHVTPWYYPATYWGGPISTLYHMNNALARISGVEIKVLTTDSAGPKVSDRLTEEEKCTPLPYEVVFTRRLADLSISPGMLRALPLWVRWADVVHLTYIFSFPSIPTLILCWLYRKPVVWSLRGALLTDENRDNYDPQSWLKHALKAGWHGICRSLISPKRVALHVTTVQERESADKVYLGARFAVIPNGVEVPDTLPERDRWLPNGQLRLMFMGRLAPVKGIENLLRAMARLDIPVSLDIYGTGSGNQGGRNYSEGLVVLARELGLLNEKVRFLGHVNGEAKARAFMEADVCMIPSYSENFCVVVAEALALGLPVIVSDRLAWAEVASRGCGLVVGNDPASLAEAASQIREMDLAEMGETGWRWMKERFEWDFIVKEMYELYQEIT